MIRTTTRSRVAAEAIRDREPFVTSGHFGGSTRIPQPGSLGGPWGSGQLRGTDLDWYRHDDATGTVDYVVWSYSTPIAWHMTCLGSFNNSEFTCDTCGATPEAHDDGGAGTWHRVGQTFSNTTSKHQSNLYLIDKPDHQVHLSPIGYLKGETVRDRWRVECDTCGTVVSCHPLKKDAASAAHTHRIAGR